MKPSTAIIHTLRSLAGRALALAALLALSIGSSTALAGNLTWNTSTGTWDINTTANWTGDATKYLDGDAVTFNNTSGGTVTIATGGVLPGATAVSAASGTYTISGAALGGSGGLTKSGGGILVLSGVNTYSGGTTVSAGSLTIGSVSTRSGTTITGSATGIGNVTLAGGVTLPNANGMTWYAPKVTLQGDITLEGINRQAVGFKILDLDGGTRTIYVNPTGGNNKQTIPGNTALEGTGRNRWEMGNDVGNMTVQNGSLVLSSNLTGNDYAGFMFRDATSFTSNLGVTVGPNVFLQANNANSLGSTTADTPKLIVNGIWGLLGTGGTGRDQTIYSLAGSGRVYASLTSANVNSRAITINGTAGSTEFSGELSNGAGTAPLSIVKNGASTQIFSGPNTYTGATTVSGGTLTLGNTKALGFGGLIGSAFTGTTTVSSGYTLDFNGTTDINEPITLNGTGIGANGALVNNSGTPASIGSGIAAVQVASAGSGYSAVPAVNISGTGTAAEATASLGVTAASFGITSGGAYSTKPTAAITGGGGSGATVTLNWSGSSPNFTITGITIASAGTGFTSVPTITLSGGVGTAAVLTANANNFAVVGVAMTAAGSGYTGTPAYTFGSGNATPGTVTLSSVSLANASSIGGSGDITIDAVVSQSGGTRSLTKVGAGTLTLTGVNTYSGATAVNGGKLLVNSPGSLASGSAVTVANTATLGGSGTINGTVTVSAGGTTLLGASGATLTFANSTAPSYALTSTLKILASASTLDKISANATSGNSVVNVDLVIDTTGLSGDIASTTIYSAGDSITGPFHSVSVIGNSGYVPTLDYSTSGQIKLALTSPLATKLVFTSTAVSTPAGVPSGIITVQRQDASSNPITADPSITVTLSSNSAGAKTFTPSFLTIANGSSSATFTYTDAIAGTPTLTAASSGLTSATQQETVTQALPTVAFTTPGTTTWTAPAGVTSVQLLVVAGGGGAGLDGAAGGGGAGGLIYYGPEAGAVASSYAVTPGTTYNITVGAGGATQASGTNSSFDAVTAVGGGLGGTHWSGTGVAGGSGGGASVGGWSSNVGGAASPAGQGFAGGNSSAQGSQYGAAGGGGGGAGGAGGNAPADGLGTAGNGGPGLNYWISGTPVTYAGGGGGTYWGDPANEGVHHQGVGGLGSTGPGGGGTAVFTYVGGQHSASTAGQNGIVIVRYVQSSNPYQDWLTANGKTDTPENLKQYAFGTTNTGAIAVNSPTSITLGQSPAMQIAGADVSAVFGRRTNYLAAGLTYTVQFGSDLGTWYDSTDTANLMYAGTPDLNNPEVIATDGDMDAVKVPFPLFIKVGSEYIRTSQQFMRVGVSVAP